MAERKDGEPRESARTEAARSHDDSDLIAAADEQTPGQQGRAGGELQRAVGTRDARKRADDPDAHTRPMKSEGEGLKGFSPNERPGNSV